MASSSPDYIRLESKIERLQEATHENHLELLDLLRADKDAINKEITELKLTTQRHSGYFSMVLKALGLGGIVTSWLSLKDLWPHK